MLNFDSKLKKRQYAEIWEEYCGFLDMDINDYMTMQNRLMDEQIKLWSNSQLAYKFLRGRKPENANEFRKMIPLTTYDDYADILLQKKTEMLPDEPILWIETTWEGGCNPVKAAPYTSGMIENFKHNLMAILVLCTTTSRGVFNMRPYENVLYGFAPLPYLTGLIPLAFSDETSLEFLPPVKEALKMSFSECNKRGFKMGLSSGIDYFFGMGSVAFYISKSIASMGSGSSQKSGLSKFSPKVIAKLLKAKSLSKKQNRGIIPKDLYSLKGFVCAGTDNECYKDELEDLWGVRPMEIFMGTEPTCIGTETWNKDGMYFFPDACFYEFIPENDMYKSLKDKDYKPRTCLMNEVVPGEKYELVISNFKGGAFVRYRVGDVYRCVGLSSSADGTKIPRFKFVDRIPTIIDIGGFTRISENSIKNVIQLSGLPIYSWFAAKEFNEDGHPYMHIYAEIEKGALVSHAISTEILKEHLGVYFKYVDHDYNDLKEILGMDPLKITIVRCGTFDEYHNKTGKTMEYMNPPVYEINDFIRLQKTFYDYCGR